MGLFKKSDIADGEQFQGKLDVQKNSSSLKVRFCQYRLFLLINGLLASLIAFRYLAYVSDLAGVMSWSYAVIALVGQLPFLVFFSGLFTLPLILIKNNAIRTILMAAIASFGLGLLVLDTLVFDLYRLHINLMLVGMVFSGGIVEIGFSTRLIAATGILVLFIIEYFIYRWLCLRVKTDVTQGISFKSRLSRFVKGYSVLVIMAIVSMHTIHVWGSARGNNNITSMTQYFPLFYPATASSFMRKYGFADDEALSRQKKLKFSSSSDTLKYPLTALSTQTVDKPKNILFIVLDTWRADAFSEEFSPNLWQLSQKGGVFKNHISTGNTTRTGIFGLFYGIPGTYWQSFLSNQKSPVFIDRLQELNYDLGIFTSAHLISPEFNRTVFSQVENLRVRSKGKTSPERDIEVTDEWLKWNASRDKSQPAFSFVFYDSLHAFDFPEDYKHHFKPMSSGFNYLEFDNNYNATPVINRYHNSTHFVDSLAGKIINQLEESGELENTLIVITSDHGEEFNDNKKNYWGHNSNFTSPQIHIPLAIIGAGADIANEWNKGELATTHEDIVPTLMSQYLGVTSPILDYSTGINLLSTPQKRGWLVTSSYSRYAIIENTNILEVYNAGTHQYLDQYNNPINKTPNFKRIKQVLDKITHFIK